MLSKSTRQKDLLKKLNLYMKSGVLEYWVVDTVNKQISVYHFADRDIEANITFVGDMIVKSFVFDGLQIALDKIFTWKQD